VTANRIACSMDMSIRLDRRARDHRREPADLVAHRQIDRHVVVAADPGWQVAEILARDEADEA
jgi:hypothetical protein